MTRDETRVEPACEQSREDVRFEIGKVVADADPLAASERVVGEGMATLLSLGEKAIRIEARSV